jgi:hypothetical protein
MTCPVAGQTAFLAPGSGFCVECHLFKVRLPPDLPGLDGHGRPTHVCLLNCGNPDCREWPDVLIVDAPMGHEATNGHHLAYVSECEMFEAPHTARTPPICRLPFTR